MLPVHRYLLVSTQFYRPVPEPFEGRYLATALGFIILAQHADTQIVTEAGAPLRKPAEPVVVKTITAKLPTTGSSTRSGRTRGGEGSAAATPVAAAAGGARSTAGSTSGSAAGAGSGSGSVSGSGSRSGSPARSRK